MKKLLVMLLVLLSLILALTSCDISQFLPDPERLETPQIRLEGNIAYWKEDLDAEKFEISVNGTIILVENTVTSMVLNEGDVLKIRAVGDGTNFETSRWSNPVTYEEDDSFEEDKFIVIWMNGNVILETDRDVLEGTIPKYDGETPTKKSDSQFTYTFSGWSPEISEVTNDITYVATFISTPIATGSNKYTVTWMNGNIVLETDRDVLEGAIPTYDGDTPTKESDGQFIYIFAGWSPEISAVTGNVIYTAVFTPSIDTCTVIFKNWDGSILKEEIVSYSGNATAPADPKRDGYEFSGWDKSFTDVTENIVVTALYEKKTHSIEYRNLKTPEKIEESSYDEVSGLKYLPIPEADGYEFIGWYTASQGGDVVDYIPAGSTKDYILFARWELITYTITYKDAPAHSNPYEYTVEDEFELSDAEWKGLKFSGWTDGDLNLLERIEKGTTGNIVLTANWRRYENNVVNLTNGTFDNVQILYDSETGMYFFMYPIAVIENVVLENITLGQTNLKYNTQSGDLTFGLSNTVSIEQGIADSIAETISNSVSRTNDWSEATGWSESHSKTHDINHSVSIGKEFPVKLFKIEGEFSWGKSETDESSNNGTTTKGGSESTGSEESRTISSTLSYAKQMSSTSSTSFTLSKDMPVGYYAYVYTGNVDVYAMVTYDSKNKNYYLDTYSSINNLHEMVLYYKDAGELKNQTCADISYNVPFDDIESWVLGAKAGYSIVYDANGGIGEMPTPNVPVNSTYRLDKNKFTRPGYTFSHWEVRTQNGVSIYLDSQGVRNLANRGESITLYAKWVANTDTAYKVLHQKLNKNGEVALSEIEVFAGTTGAIVQPKVKMYEGYTSPILQNVTIAADGTTVLIYKYTPNTYDVKFDIQCSYGPYTYQIVFDDPQKWVPTHSDGSEYWEFTGWYLESTCSEFSRVCGSDGKYTLSKAENHTMYAGWKKPKEYEDYIYIYDVDELKNIVNNKKYVLMENIDLSKLEGGWTPLDSFSGVLDGRGHSISNLRIDYGTSGRDIVVLGFVRKNVGTIKNIVFKNAFVKDYGREPYEYHVGIIAGENIGTIEACEIINSCVEAWAGTTDTSHNFIAMVGGICGVNNGVLNGCSATKSQVFGQAKCNKATAYSYTGGIVGKNNNYVSSCSSRFCTITAEAGGVNSSNCRCVYYAGGIVGSNASGCASKVISCFSSDSTYILGRPNSNGLTVGKNSDDIIANQE